MPTFFDVRDRLVEKAPNADTGLVEGESLNLSKTSMEP